MPGPKNLVCGEHVDHIEQDTWFCGVSRFVVVRGALPLGLGLSACGSKLRVRVLCVAILGSDVGQNGSENVGDHKLVSDLGKNRSENSPTRLKTGRRFSVSDLSPTVNAQPGPQRHCMRGDQWR